MLLVHNAQKHLNYIWLKGGFDVFYRHKVKAVLPFKNEYHKNYSSCLKEMSLSQS